MSNNIVASIVIAVCNDKRLEYLLESLASQENQTYAFEVLVIENGSFKLEDISRRMSGKLNIKYFNLPFPNSAKARNLGIEKSEGEFILMTDADVIVEKSWVKNMVNSLKNSNFAAVGGQIKKLSLNTWIQRGGITVVNGQTSLNYLPATSYPYIVGANVGYRAEIIKKLGGFDEELKSGADVDICYKLGYRGYTIAIIENSIVYHEDRETWQAHFHRFAFYAEYQVLLFKKYKHLTKKKFILNPYPIKRIIGVFFLLPLALIFLIVRRPNLMQRLIAQLIEVFGIWWGTIKGAIKHRQFYI